MSPPLFGATLVPQRESVKAWNLLCNFGCKREGSDGTEDGPGTLRAPGILRSFVFTGFTGIRNTAVGCTPSTMPKLLSLGFEVPYHRNPGECYESTETVALLCGTELQGLRLSIPARPWGQKEARLGALGLYEGLNSWVVVLFIFLW